VKRLNPIRLLRSPASWFAQRSVSMLWCHIAGTTISIVILAAIAYVWSQRNEMVAQVTAGEVVIDIDDAAHLIAEADSWRQQYTTAFRESEAIDARVASIRDWLPKKPDLDATHATVRSIAETNGITLIEFSPQGTHVGQRVGVVAATCRLDGSFADLCRFLHAICGENSGIACDKIVLDRVNVGPGEDVSGMSPCAAVVSLRVPFAADATTAARLLSQGTSDAG
jgi:hypothetical protein